MTRIVGAVVRNHNCPPGVANGSGPRVYYAICDQCGLTFPLRESYGEAHSDMTGHNLAAHWEEVSPGAAGG